VASEKAVDDASSLPYWWSQQQEVFSGGRHNLPLYAYGKEIIVQRCQIEDGIYV